MSLNRVRRFVSVLVVANAVACGGDDVEEMELAGDTPPPGPVYVALSRTIIAGSGGRQNLITPVAALEPVALDTSVSIEVGGFTRIRAFENALYVFNGENGVITRYTVTDALELEEEAQLSFANEGITSFFQSLGFVSPTRAFYFDSQARRAVIWNPSAMEVISSFDLTPLEREGFDNITLGRFSVVGDRLVLPVTWQTNPISTRVVPTVALVVVPTDDDNPSVAVFEDDRCAMSRAGFVDSGSYYVLGDWRDGVYDVYSPVSLPPPCLLRFDPAAGVFDSGFYRDLRTSTGAPHVSGGTPLGGGTFC